MSRIETLCAKGAAALPAVKRYLFSAESISWPLRVLDKIAESTEQELAVIEEVLARHEPGYERDPTKKIQLVNHLGQLKQARCEPKPVQKPYPPFVIGGSGEQLTLRVVAQYADVWNSMPADVEEFRHKVSVLHEHGGSAQPSRNTALELCRSQQFVRQSQPLHAARAHAARAAELAALAAVALYMQVPRQPLELNGRKARQERERSGFQRTRRGEQRVILGAQDDVQQPVQHCQRGTEARADARAVHHMRDVVADQPDTGRGRHDISGTEPQMLG